MEKGINVLSLFDGMSCGQIALERAGIKVNKYFASEIDKYAMHIAMKNYPNTIQLGSITDLKYSGNHKIDLVIGGSPCQGFSMAGKQLNFNDERSKLFFDFVELLNKVRIVNPNVLFLLENVKMKKEYQDVISSYLGVEPIEINSALVSAQSRKRLYWTNILNINQPEDKVILLKNILEDEVDQRYCLSDKMIKSLTTDKDLGNGVWKAMKPKECTEKSSTLTARMAKMGKSDTYIKINKKGNIKQNQNKASCFTAGGNSGGNHSDMDLLLSNERIRRLTPIECERLQTVPDNYTEGVSDTQRYKMLGNGWTVSVVSHIFKNINL